MSKTIMELEKLQPKDLDAGLVFSGSASGKKTKGYDTPNSFTPEIDPDYLFHESSRDA